MSADVSSEVNNVAVPKMLQADWAYSRSVLVLMLLANGCGHASGARNPAGTPAASRDLPSAYSEWLAGTGLSGVISVQSYDSGAHRLVLSVTEQYPVLCEIARERRLDLPRKLYLKLRQLLPRSARDARVSVKGLAPCLAAEVREQDEEILVDEEACRSADTIELSADLVAAVTNSPAGTLAARGSAQLVDQIVRRVEARLRGQGQFSLISKKEVSEKKGASANFELQGMRGQVLEGERWWETVQVLLTIQGESNAGGPVNIAWQATGRYGAGFRPPPLEGYNADMEPAHAVALSKYVSKLLTMVLQDLETSYRQ